jgi:DDE superfamily endonuclease
MAITVVRKKLLILFIIKDKQVGCIAKKELKLTHVCMTTFVKKWLR